jgi:multidrug efflux system outer membrane protein
MRINWRYSILASLIIGFAFSGCKLFDKTVRKENTQVPESYFGARDSSNSADVNWRTYFSDPNLVALIDTALKNNQELNLMLQEIEISKNDIKARNGEYLPFVNIAAGSGLEKEGLYTRKGAVDEQLTIKDEKPFPEPLGDFMVGAYANWEVDIWKKLRNAKQSAAFSYLATVEGKNFMVTNLVAEIADAYYELLALDNLLSIIDQNVQVQSDALEVVKQQKEAARVSQLAVNRFEAQLLNTQNLQYDIKQRIVETENRINFLTARFPARIERTAIPITDIAVDSIQFGIPSQLLINRPDIRQAELQLAASKLDVKVARANFYPSLGIRAGVGFQAFNPAFLLNPESMLYNLAGDLMAPVINRNAIKATYFSANAKQLGAVYQYEQTILGAYVDILNQISKLENYSQSFSTKQREVDLLKESVNISISLFNSARADYMEVLLTQREALESRVELIEIKLKQMSAKVNIYRALGGGWK